MYYIMGGAQLIWGLVWLSFALNRPSGALYSIKQKNELYKRSEPAQENVSLSISSNPSTSGVQESGIDLEEDEDEIRLLSKQDIVDLTSEPACDRRSFTSVPWRLVLSHHCVWIVLANQFANNYSGNIFNAWIPTFLKRTLGFDLSETGFIAVLPYILQGM